MGRLKVSLVQEMVCGLKESNELKARRIGCWPGMIKEIGGTTDSKRLEI